MVGLIVGAFDEASFLEYRTGADEGDEVGCVDGAPAGLGGLDQLERHRDPGSAGTGTLRDGLSRSDCGYWRLYRVRGAQVTPVLGGIVIDLQQQFEVVGGGTSRLRGNLRDGLGPLGPVLLGEGHRSSLGVGTVFGLPDLG